MLYHLKPVDLTGDVLIPLNHLKKLDEALYQKAVKKYKGRQTLLKHIIPKLNCCWNEVLFFSPVHPEKIKDIFIEVDLTWKLFDRFELNPV